MTEKNEYATQLKLTGGTPLSRYEREALRTASADMATLSSRIRTDLSVDLIHACLGLASESGEFCDAVKKAIYYGREIDRINLVEELGDVLWYINLAAHALGVRLDLIMEANLKKLRARYPEKFSETSATERDLEAERREIEAYAEFDCVEF